ncbi:MAG: histidine kinase dimerization/phospho-acceptor domain-containing protein [Leisingera sp.]
MALLVAMVCCALVSIPLAAMLTVRLTSSQFVRETEQALLQQGAIYAEIYRSRFEAAGGRSIGSIPEQEVLEFWASDLRPARASINLRRDPVLPPMPAGEEAGTLSDPRHRALLPALIDMAREAGKSTLAGVIFLDHEGNGTGEEGLRSHAGLPEVQAALAGKLGTVLRARDDAYGRHPLASLSRDTGYRVFVGYPVLSYGRVIGVVLLSRTPLNLSKFLFRERDALIIMALFTLTGAVLTGYLLLRLMSQPVRGLRDEAQAIAEGGKPPAQPLQHYGVRELAELGQSMLSMAGTLHSRSREIATYTDHVTHELKSPVTSITGAAELLSEPALSADDRRKLLDNIRTEAARMNTLLTRLREMSQLRQAVKSGPGRLQDMLPEIEGLEVRVGNPGNAPLPLSEEHGRIILAHMAQNARAHGAKVLTLAYSDGLLRISDDGEGLSECDLPRLADPFFTTRREEGGTGMGLAIVTAVLDGYGAVLTAAASPQGAVFEIRFP